MLLTCCEDFYVGECLWRPVTQGILLRRDGRYVWKGFEPSRRFSNFVLYKLQEDKDPPFFDE
jgi:hypothetical protein